MQSSGDPLESRVDSIGLAFVEQLCSTAAVGSDASLESRLEDRKLELLSKTDVFLV